MVTKRKVTLEQLVHAMQGTCSTCHHWERQEQDECGTCHRYPPQVVFAGADDSGGDCYSVWPQTDLTDQCGEFRPGQ